MSDQRTQDEGLLIDFLLRQCDEASAEKVRLRLETDADFRNLHNDLRNTLGAVALIPQVDPPEDLVSKTLSRIQQVRITEELITRQELSRPPVLRATFSLREAIAIAAAVLVMAVVVVPSVFDARQRAEVTRCATQEGQIGAAMLAYANENNGSLPSTPSSSAHWLNCDGNGATSNSSGLFRLVNAGLASPQTFQCPSAHGGGASGFAVQAGMSDFPADKFINYSYQHTLGRGLSLNDPILRKVISEMAVMSDANPLFVNGRFQPSRLNVAGSDNHNLAGQNVLYMDGHVDWADKPTVGVIGNNIYLAEGIYKYCGDEKPTSPTDSFLLPAYSGR